MKVFMFLMGLLLCTPLHADNLLNVQFADGSTLAIPFSQAPEISYPDYKTIVVATSDGQTSYTFDDEVRFSYAAENSTGIKGLAAGAHVTAGSIRVSGMKPGEAVTVCNLKGQTVASVKADADGTAMLETGALRDDVLIVGTPTTSFKIKK